MRNLLKSLGICLLAIVVMGCIFGCGPDYEQDHAYVAIRDTSGGQTYYIRTCERPEKFATKEDIYIPYTGEWCELTWTVIGGETDGEKGYAKGNANSAPEGSVLSGEITFSVKTKAHGQEQNVDVTVHIIAPEK